MENKIVLFSNIKGGVGKTTLCAFFANYLAEKKETVAVLDADIQASLFRHRSREERADPDADCPWQITQIDTADAEKVQKVMQTLKKIPGVVLVDCPGNLNDKNLAYIYRNADMICIPMSYDPDTVDATGIFVKVLRQIVGDTVKIVFVPNRINTSEGKAEELRQRAQTQEMLGLIGTVTPRIKQGVAIKRYSTIYPLDKYQRMAVEHAFDVIIEELNK